MTTNAMSAMEKLAQMRADYEFDNPDFAEGTSDVCVGDRTFSMPTAHNSGFEKNYRRIYCENDVPLEDAMDRYKAFFHAFASRKEFSRKDLATVYKAFSKHILDYTFDAAWSRAQKKVYNEDLAKSAACTCSIHTARQKSSLSGGQSFGKVRDDQCASTARPSRSQSRATSGVTGMTGLLNRFDGVGLGGTATSAGPSARQPPPPSAPRPCRSRTP